MAKLLWKIRDVAVTFSNDAVARCLVISISIGDLGLDRRLVQLLLVGLRHIGRRWGWGG